jgi:hypothetical protein
MTPDHTLPNSCHIFASTLVTKALHLDRRKKFIKSVKAIRRLRERTYFVMCLTIQIMALTLGRGQIANWGTAAVTQSVPSNRRFWHRSITLSQLSVIPGFHRYVNEICALLGFYAAYGVRTDVSGQPIVPIFKGQQSSWTKLLPVNSRRISCLSTE